MSPRRFVAALLTIACALLASCPPALAARVVRCESERSRYRYCRVDTKGNVKVKKQLSDTDCQRGRTWGFDRSGIWVDHGCRADFSVGGGSKDSGGSSGTAAALGIGAVAGVALLGALLNGQDSGAKAPAAEMPSARAAAGGAASSGDAWTVGTFSGYDARRKAQLQLTISSGGQALAEVPKHASVAGFVQGDVLRLGDEVFTLAPDANGLRAVRSGNGGDILFGRLR